DVVVHLHEVGEAACAETLQNGIELGCGLAGFDEVDDELCIDSHRAKLLSGFRLALSLQLVDGLIKLVLLACIGTMGVEEIPPRIPAAQTHDKILRSQAQRTKTVDDKGDQFGVSTDVLFADDVGVELEVLAQSPLLLAFIAEKLRNAEPF